MVSPAQPPPVTVHSALARVPRACGDTAVSRALVELVEVPPHLVAAPVHATVAAACDTLTGPDTAATPGDAAPSVGSRSATVVSDPVPQLPDAPCTVHVEDPLLDRVPITSPDAAPDVAADPPPVHVATAQSACAPDALVAISSRAATVRPAAVAPSASVAASATWEPASASQAPPLV